MTLRWFQSDGVEMATRRLERRAFGEEGVERKKVAVISFVTEQDTYMIKSYIRKSKQKE